MVLPFLPFPILLVDHPDHLLPHDLHTGLLVKLPIGEGVGLWLRLGLIELHLRSSIIHLLALALLLDPPSLIGIGLKQYLQLGNINHTPNG